MCKTNFPFLAIDRYVKLHNPRVIRVSRKLIDMLEKLPKRIERAFITSMDSIYKNLRVQRRKPRENLQAQDWKTSLSSLCNTGGGTMEYHKTKGILHIKKILGHKCIRSTMVYINLDQA